MPTLILTPRFTDDSQALWRAAGRLGWDVERLTSWRLPAHLLSVQEPVFYLEGLFAQTLAEQFEQLLLEPPLDWLPQLPEAFRKRHVTLTTLKHARENVSEPAFIKPPNDKSFPARVCVGSELPLDDFDDDAPVLVSEVISWEKEFRCFILDRKIRTLSIYLRDGVLQREHDFAASDAEESEARRFMDTVLADARVELPRAAVVDVGLIKDRGWAVVEQNAAWGSGIYGCDPEQVLEVIRFASPEENDATRHPLGHT